MTIDKFLLLDKWRKFPKFQKRLEGLTEAELEALLEQVEEEKRRLASGEQINWSSSKSKDDNTIEPDVKKGQSICILIHMLSSSHQYQRETMCHELFYLHLLYSLQLLDG